MDVLNAKTVGDKLRWAFLVFDPKRKGFIEAGFSYMYLNLPKPFIL